MKCPICGASRSKKKPQQVKSGYSAVDEQLNQIKRGRTCTNGHAFNTLEIWEGEVHRLRGLAYLGLNKEIDNV